LPFPTYGLIHQLAITAIAINQGNFGSDLAFCPGRAYIADGARARLIVDLETVENVILRKIADDFDIEACGRNFC
jgi:hypothetical protein